MLLIVIFQSASLFWRQSGKIYTGCNVENASYGGTTCAERNAIAAAVSLLASASFSALGRVYTPQEKLTPPCGICRQVIAEFFTPQSPIASCNHLGAAAAMDFR